MDTTCRLYLITPPRFDPAAFADPLAEALDAGDVACVQLRLKEADDDKVRRSCERLRPLVQERDTAFLLNDRPDLAAETGCDGVHLGPDDAPYEEARRLVGDDAIIGISCRDSRHLGLVAAEKGADYVAFGAFYPSTTKTATGRPTPDLLTWWSKTTAVSCVAIGGITAANLAPLVNAGADFVAVISAVWEHREGPAVAVRELNQAIAKARQS